MTTKGAAPPSFLRAADLFECAAAELLRLQAENERLRAEQAQAMSEASSLAMSLFRKHYSSDPDYASGAVKFGLCDDLRGVISQIDNMSTGLARAELEARKPLPLSDEQIERLREQAFSTNNPFCPCDSKTMRKAVRAAERAHGIKEP
jgi:hypothetical protein